MKTCLIVDDSKVIRMVARRILEGLDFAIAEAADGQKAIESCRTKMPDAILLDWNMPVMNGIDFLRELRKMDGGTEPVVVFCTTENDIGHIQEAIQAGANEYIMKPFDSDIIQAKFSQVGLSMNPTRAEVPATPPVAGPIRILVVDDSAVIRGLITRAARSPIRELAVVGSVGNGQQAIATLRRVNVDIVVLDIEMPVMDGLTALPLMLRSRAARQDHHGVDADQAERPDQLEGAVGRRGRLCRQADQHRRDPGGPGFPPRAGGEGQGAGRRRAQAPPRPRRDRAADLPFRPAPSAVRSADAPAWSRCGRRRTGRPRSSPSAAPPAARRRS